MDRVGIIIAVAITAVAVSITAVSITFTATEGKDSYTPTIEKVTSPTKELKKEAASAKLPEKFTSIPQGTSLPGCEEVDLCYDQSFVTTFVGSEIIWRNDDLSAHTVTSGIIPSGPDGNFDSGLILPGETFSHRFNETGKYPYYCMMHPWATGSVSVEKIF